MFISIYMITVDSGLQKCRNELKDIHIYFRNICYIYLYKQVNYNQFHPVFIKTKKFIIIIPNIYELVQETNCFKHIFSNIENKI